MIDIVLYAVTFASLCALLIVLYIATKALHIQNEIIARLTTERDSAERSMEIYKAAYETVVDRFINENKKETEEPTCENCWWRYRNPIGGEEGCKHYPEPRDEVCEHYIKN